MSIRSFSTIAINQNYISKLCVVNDFGNLLQRKKERKKERKKKLNVSCSLSLNVFAPFRFIIIGRDVAIE